MNNLALHYGKRDLSSGYMRTGSKFLLFFLAAASINCVFCIQEAQAQFTDFRAYKEKSNRDFEARIKAMQMEHRLSNPGDVELKNKAQKYGMLRKQALTLGSLTPRLTNVTIFQQVYE